MVQYAPVIVILVALVSYSSSMPTLPWTSSFENELDSVITSVEEGSTSLIESVSQNAESVESKLNSTVTGATDEASDGFSHVTNFFASAANSTSHFFSSAAGSTKQAITSTWNDAVGWWYDLEEEFKEFLHFLLRGAEVLVGLLIFGAIMWAVHKGMKIYNFLNSGLRVGQETIEMGLRGIRSAVEGH